MIKCKPNSDRKIKKEIKNFLRKGNTKWLLKGRAFIMARIHNECVFSELFLNDLEQVASQRISEKVLALKTVEKIMIIQEKMLSGELIFNEHQGKSIFSFDIYNAMGCLDFVFQLSKKVFCFLFFFFAHFVF